MWGEANTNKHLGLNTTGLPAVSWDRTQKALKGSVLNCIPSHWAQVSVRIEPKAITGHWIWCTKYREAGVDCQRSRAWIWQWVRFQRQKYSSRCDISEDLPESLLVHKSVVSSNVCNSAPCSNLYHSTPLLDGKTHLTNWEIVKENHSVSPTLVLCSFPWDWEDYLSVRNSIPSCHLSLCFPKYRSTCTRYVCWLIGTRGCDSSWLRLSWCKTVMSTFS